MADEAKVVIEVVAGAEGPCLSVNDTRVAGPKPWGGGKVTHKWQADPSRLIDAIPEAKVLADALEASMERCRCGSGDPMCDVCFNARAALARVGRGRR